MDRVLQVTPATASVTYYEDGVAVDPGTVTIGITHDDGTVLVAAGTATSGSGTSPRTFALTTTHTATLDLLRLTWTSGTKGLRVTYVEVVGGFLTSLTALRKIVPLNDTSTYPTADVTEARTAAEVALEDACHLAFAPRYGRDRLDGNGSVDVLLTKPRPQSVLSVTVGGVALDSTALAALVVYQDGRLYNPSGWTSGRGNVIVTYTHGYPFPPPRVGEAIGKMVKRILVDSPVSDRATSLINPDGTTTFMVTAGVREAVFDVPLANAVVNSYGVGGPAVG